jgi:stearoyl-CoA desaturase (delta-9 desaturase)
MIIPWLTPRTGDSVTYSRHSAQPLHHDDIIYPSAIGFVLVHLACFAALWTGVSATSLTLCVAFYLLRMFAITAGFHRYFSHRTFKTGRVFQFILAFVGQMSAQSGHLWWAAKHREHHTHSDSPTDVHSPAQHGFFFAHVGWIFRRHHREADYSSIPDLTRYPELVWLDKRHTFPAATLALICLAIDGWTGLIVGFAWSTVLTYHGTFAINSLAHCYGNQRYVTGDDSRNNWFLALITLGEGWHNNHHYYQASTRQGFRWWEVDATYYLLKALSWIGVVSDLRSPPAEVLAGARALPRPIVERVARQLAAGFERESLSQQARSFLAAELATVERALGELRERGSDARAYCASLFADVHLPELPNLETLKQHAQETLAHTPSLDDIALRAREILVETLLDKWQPQAMAAPA